ncbi:hypothetical protein VSS93_28815, partial [Pseudomonas syringae pv. tagetis]
LLRDSLRLTQAFACNAGACRDYIERIVTRLSLALQPVSDEAFVVAYSAGERREAEAGGFHVVK